MGAVDGADVEPRGRIRRHPLSRSFQRVGDLRRLCGFLASRGYGMLDAYPRSRGLTTMKSGPSRRHERPLSRVGNADTAYVVDPRVDSYIDALPGWQQAICREVRDIIHAADREVIETIKRGRQPYFVLQGNVCALLAAKDHVNVFLYDGGIVPDPEGIITAGQANKTARTIAIRQGDKVHAPALTAILRQIIANNRAGGWRRLKG